MSTSTQPLVSIGMPVYNGEKYLRKALDTLLAQDYTNFELIISDNNSKDSTGAICREFEARDSRIRYIRQAENHGSPWNFVFVLEQAEGNYFMWAAHDDWWDPRYISECLKKLQAHPEAVLACTEINFIDGEDKPSPYLAGWKNLDTSGMTPAARIHQMIAQMSWYATYGLLRPEAIRKVKSLGLSAYGADVLLLMELILMGHFVKIPEPLFNYRIVKPKSAADFQADFNSEKNPLPPTRTPLTGLAAGLMEVVWQSSLSPEEKIVAFADFIRTMSSPNVGWRQAITWELLGANSALNDAGFAFLLGQILARAVPLSEIHSNPLLRALYSPPRTVPDVLTLADKVLASHGSSMGGSAEEKHKKATLLFEQGEVEEASSLFAEALKIEETSDRWVNWATTQIARNRPLDAESGLRRALQLDSGHALASLKLGILMAHLGRFEAALPLLERSLQTLPVSERGEVMRLVDGCRARAETTAHHHPSLDQ